MPRKPGDEDLHEEQTDARNRDLPLPLVKAALP
jgi:hypothetical protein